MMIAQALECLFAGDCQSDGEAFATESFGNRFCQLPLVFYDQNVQ